MSISGDYPVGFVLVALSSAFCNRELLRSKLSLYLKNLSEVDVISINDSKGIVQEVLGERLIDSLGPAMSLREKRMLVKAAGWVIAFWDGNDVTDVLHLALTSG